MAKNQTTVFDVKRLQNLQKIGEAAVKGKDGIDPQLLKNLSSLGKILGNPKNLEILEKL